MTKPGVILVSVFFVCVHLVHAEPLVSIQTLLSPQAGSYQRHVVTVEGVASDVSVLPPVVGRKGCLLHGRSIFMLEDDTGIIPVEVIGACSPSAADGLPKDGDQIRLTAQVHVLHNDPPQRHVILQARSIQILVAQ